MGARWGALLLASLATLSRAQQPPAILDDHDGAVAVQRFFAAKCIDCHGSHLAEAKGDLNFILDLPRLIDEKLIRPGRPEESDLYLMLKKGKMPPRESQAGPATAAEIEQVRAWIAGESPVAAPSTPRARPPHALVLLGRLHPLTVHFPIALLIVAALAECIDAVRRRPTFAIARNLCIGLGAAGAVAAAALGWLMAWADAHSGQTLELHRWLGTGAAALALAAAFVTLRLGRRTSLVRAALLAGAILVGLAAHFGGMLVFGSGYFS